MTIKKAAVLGAGVMGAQIAGHLAGCGIPVYLLDLELKFVEQGLERLKKSKPSAMYDLADLKLISTGTFKDDLKKISECDWIVEAVIEKMDIKKGLYAEIEKNIKPGAIISSNTSGIRLSQLVEGRTEQFKKNFIITHFFNPVRYMKLVELIKGPQTDPVIVKEMVLFLENNLGKGVVYAKDTPNFIANRIGVHAVVSAFYAAVEHGWPIEVIDQVMGEPTARPKSAIFRTADIVGIDTLALVAKNNDIKMPGFVEEMIKHGWIGEKSGGGFYKKVQGEILALDPKTMEYRSQQKIKTPSLGKVREMADPVERLKTVVFADDEAGKIAWELVSKTVAYVCDCKDEISDTIEDIDKAMKWGFNWDLGPFEQMRALEDKLTKFAEFTKLTKLGREKTGVQKKVVKNNAGADITDLGDGIFACEFHTKMNAIDGDVVAMLNQAIDLVEKEGVGLIIGNDGQNFSAGANLMMVFLAAQNGSWDQVDNMVRGFQNINQRIRFCKKPVVVAPAGLALGGGCEISIAGSAVCAAAETYMGLVEVGVGLIPAGCGCKNMVLKMEAIHSAAFKPTDKIWFAALDGGPFPKVRDAFQTIAFAKVSTSAKEAIKIGYMKRSDVIVLDRVKLFGEAKKKVLELSKTYQPPLMREDILLPGNSGKMSLVNGIRQAQLHGDISEHDGVIGEKLAHILAGGDKPTLHKTNEQHILDLEREAFLSLCGMEKTQARIQHMLMNGKPLRN